MKITLKDLARECNCSITTVSRALKDSDTISQELRHKIQTLAQEWGYVPNQIAGSLRTGATNTIAFILQDFRNPFYSLMAKYIEEYASVQNYSTLFFTTREIADMEVKAVYTALQKNVDGILLIPNQQGSPAMDLLKKSEIPFVVLGRVSDDETTDSVEFNDQKGAYLITKHMLERGCRNLMFINSFMYISSSRKRLKGFQQALGEYDIPFDSQHTFNISTQLGETQKLIDTVFSKPNPFDGLFCYCDVMAYEAIYALNQLGIRVPEDLRVVGVDHIRADIINPCCLTSIFFDREKAAQYIVDILTRRITAKAKGNPNTGPYREILEPHLVIGNTT